MRSFAMLLSMVVALCAATILVMPLHIAHCRELPVPHVHASPHVHAPPPPPPSICCMKPACNPVVTERICITAECSCLCCNGVLLCAAHTPACAECTNYCNNCPIGALLQNDANSTIEKMFATLQSEMGQLRKHPDQMDNAEHEEERTTRITNSIWLGPSLAALGAILLAKLKTGWPNSAENNQASSNSQPQQQQENGQQNGGESANLIPPDLF